MLCRVLFICVSLLRSQPRALLFVRAIRAPVLRLCAKPAYSQCVFLCVFCFFYFKFRADLKNIFEILKLKDF